MQYTFYNFNTTNDLTHKPSTLICSRWSVAWWTSLPWQNRSSNPSQESGKHYVSSFTTKRINGERSSSGNLQNAWCFHHQALLHSCNIYDSHQTRLTKCKALLLQVAECCITTGKICYCQKETTMMAAINWTTPKPNPHYPHSNMTWLVCWTAEHNCWPITTPEFGLLVPQGIFGKVCQGWHCIHIWYHNIKHVCLDCPTLNQSDFFLLGQ